MQSLASHRSALETASSENWPFRILEFFQDVEAEFGQPERLTEIADWLFAIAKDQGCTSVLGASRLGGQIAGALIARSDNSLTMFRAAEVPGLLFVVDAVLATGTQISRAINQARGQGAERVIAAVVIAHGLALKACKEENEIDVFALEEF